MALYGEGIADPGSPCPTPLPPAASIRSSSGRPDWTAETLAAELQAINADLDAAYLENGFGA